MRLMEESGIVPVDTLAVTFPTLSTNQLFALSLLEIALDTEIQPMNTADFAEPAMTDTAKRTWKMYLSVQSFSLLVFPLAVLHPVLLAAAKGIPAIQNTNQIRRHIGSVQPLTPIL